MSLAHDYAKHHADAFRAELGDFLKIPTVSTDPAFSDEMRRGAEWLAQNMRDAGLTTDIITIEPFHPLVYGEWMGAGESAKTVLIYGHYDVQPAVIEDGWDSDPFDPIEKDGKIWARGSTDDKGQLFIHVKAVESILKATGKLPINVKFIIEGEEESGGYAISQYVLEHGNRLKADVCVISDSSMVDSNQPIILNGLRGMAAIELVIKGPKQDLHSGMYGGTVHNPLQALAEILSKLHDADGRVAVPGFYDDVLELTPQEKDEIALVPWDYAEWHDETGAPKPWGEAKYTLRERVGARPTLDINGMAGGYFERGMKSIVPAKAWAKISCRLVSNQDPDDILAKIRSYIAEITPDTVEAELTVYGGTKALLINTDIPEMQVAIDAYKKGWGAKPIFKREGGSIPIVSEFQNRLGIPAIMMGFGKDTDNLHGPNEHFSIEMFHKGIDTMIYFLTDLANI